MILGHVLPLKMASLRRFYWQQLQRSCAKWGHGMGSTRKTTVFQLKQLNLGTGTVLEQTHLVSILAMPPLRHEDAWDSWASKLG